jgi:hypothetical protein
MKKNKACIVYISSRNKCLKLSLDSIWKKYNHRHEYPVYVHYFDDIYDNVDLREKITNKLPQTVNWRSVPYETPKHISEKELFYNRKDLWYVRNSFPITRKGYLHMCHFTSNMYGYENTDLHKYEYLMTHDDEAGYIQDATFDPIEIMENREELMGALSYRVAGIKDGKPHQGYIDGSLNLWSFVKGYLRNYKITPKLPQMVEILNNPDMEWRHLPQPDTYVIKTKMFETETWKNWIKAVNKFGGNYKYRWGDCLVLGMYYHIHHGEVYDFSEEGNPVKMGIYKQNAFRHIQDYAPGVKDNSK